MQPLCSLWAREPCLRWFVWCFRVVPAFLLIYIHFQMLDHTETLKVGSRAPEFALEAANREGVLTLSGFLRRGVLIAEFLRGTW
jgi:hypothetical protein